MNISLPAKFALVSFIITLFGVLGVALMAYHESSQLLQQQVARSLVNQVQVKADRLQSQAELIRQDVVFLAQSSQLQSLCSQVIGGKVHAFDFGPVEKLFASVLVQRDMYYQIRLIGVADGGLELARVARLKRGITTVAKNKLMKKANRRYFIDGMKGSKGSFLFSDITLNREHGIITQPPQPMLRVSTPIYTEDGKPFALLLINADFNVLTTSIARGNELDAHSFFITNAQSDYLIHRDKTKSMAFEYGRSATMVHDFPVTQAWLKNSRESVVDSMKQLNLDVQERVLMLENVYFDKAHPERVLHVVGTFGLQQLREQSRNLRDKMLWLTLALALFLGLITYFVARYLTRPVRHMIDAAVRISHGDTRVQMPRPSRDEIGHLNLALQKMVNHLRKSRQQTEALNMELEAKVHDRTAKLARLADKLESQNLQLEQAVIDAEQATVVKGQFLATMSHEIRTPLNGILGLTELVLDSDMEPEQRNRVEIIQSSGQALLTILNDILDFSKIEAGQMEMKRVDLNPNKIIEHVANLFARQINTDEHQLELIVRAIPHLPRLLIGDSDRLHQVMLNLLSNAMKFTEQGEIVISADLLSETESMAHVRFQVADTGRGISEKDQQRLFEEFTQADGTDTRKHGGTGLGLSIVKRLVSMMGGVIAVESELDAGSRFFFDLKLEKSTPVADGPEQYADDFSRWRVLAVDNNVTNRAMLQDLLGAWCMCCDVSDSGEDALKRLRDMDGQKQAYDLMLIDQQMETMDGMALARIIKGMPELKSLKVIMTTTLDITFDAEVCENYGLDGFLRKPIYVNTLFETVLDVMGVRQRKLRHKSIANHRKRSERILLAEDNDVNRLVAVGILANQGFIHVDIAHDGVEALAKATEHHYDVILMDVQMPELDGIGATREIRELERFDGEYPGEASPHVPIIALTAHALDEDVQRTREAGMDDHLTKPVSGEMLQAMMAKWLPEAQYEIANDPAEEASNPEHVNEIDDHTGESAVNESELRQLRTDMGFGIGMIIDTYLAELPGQIETVKQAIDAGDGDTLRRSGHRLKGASRSIAAGEFGDLCYQLELMGGNNDMEAAKALFHNFETAAAAVEQALQADWLADVR